VTKPPDKPTSGNDKDYYKVLSDVMDDQKQRETRRQSASAVQRANRSNSNTLATIAMVCGVLSVYVWTNPPEFIQPAEFEPQAAVVDDAALRIAVGFGAGAVNRYLEENGRLPETLAETAFPSSYAESVSYTRLGAELYEIRAFDRDAGDTLVYTSDRNLQSFVGAARDDILATGNAGGGP